MREDTNKRAGLSGECSCHFQWRATRPVARLHESSTSHQDAGCRNHGIVQRPSESEVQRCGTAIGTTVYISARSNQSRGSRGAPAHRRKMEWRPTVCPSSLERRPSRNEKSDHPRAASHGRPMKGEPSVSVTRIHRCSLVEHRADKSYIPIQNRTHERARSRLVGLLGLGHA